MQKNQKGNTHFKLKSSREPRHIEQVPGGYFDDMGFYNLPEGGFYDPDGYYFNVEGFDEFGGYYDGKGFYHPGEGNKHEFEEFDDYDEEEDDLIRQFEATGHDEDAPRDEIQERYYKEFKMKERVFYEDEEEEPAQQQYPQTYPMQQEYTAPSNWTQAEAFVPQSKKQQAKQEEEVKTERQPPAQFRGGQGKQGGGKQQTVGEQAEEAKNPKEEVRPVVKKEEKQIQKGDGFSGWGGVALF